MTTLTPSMGLETARTLRAPNFAEMARKSLLNLTRLANNKPANTFAPHGPK